jgi:moderate conductance mechanosensitive channel
MTRGFHPAHRLLALCTVLIVLGALLVGFGGVRVAAQPASTEATPSPPAPASDASPAQVRALIELLGDPQVRDWLRAQLAEPPAEPATAADVAPAEAGAMSLVQGRLEAIRAQLQANTSALPRVPEALAAAWARLWHDLTGTGILGALALIGAFVGLGFGAQWLYRHLTGPALRHIVALPMDTVAERVAATLKRLGWALGWLATFTLASVGAFLLFDWPPLLRTVVLAYLLAFLGLRLALVLGGFLLEPDAERFRILPMTDEAARFWYVASGVVLGFAAFGWATMEVLIALGMESQPRRLIALTFGLGLLLIVIAIVRRQGRYATAPEEAASARRGRTPEILLTLAMVLLWLLWLMGAMPLFWLALVALALPGALHVLQRGVNHLLRPARTPAAEATVPNGVAVCLERGLRAALLIGAVLFLAWAWDVDAAGMAVGESLGEQLSRGLLQAAIVVLLADFAWHLLRAMFDRKLAEASGPAAPGSEEARRQARLCTLLPIVRNLALVVLLVMATLMALSSLGVEIGPLIAGAGVVGIAIGFGAQTLVRDIIGGMFYLLDDAFRVDEYIVSGSYKGRVESFSLRSIKLRHHRGYLNTVPFGELGAIQNMSRDWVIDRLSVGVTYDTDLDQAKKIVKQVSKDIMADPELAPNIIEPLKMQGVEQFGDFAIKLRLKMMTKPGEQFVIRRRAYGMIKKAFDANGIHFAFPTVTVAGEGKGKVSPAVAQQAIELTRKAPEASS